MKQMSVVPFAKGLRASVEMEEFSHIDGYESFLRGLCASLNERFISWHQGVESGDGEITYQGRSLKVFWTDFPDTLSFDCPSEKFAHLFQGSVSGYLSQQLAGL
jgi:hypothetical protein